jgi:hypothetical protein
MQSPPPTLALFKHVKNREVASYDIEVLMALDAQSGMVCTRFALEEG